MNDYLETFSLINILCEQRGTRAYLWGGWIPDIYTNKLLREHDDADYLILNMNAYRDILLKVHFGHLQIIGNKAEWLHNGRIGKIEFPTDWLNNQVIKFQNVDLYAVKPEFQLVLKMHNYN